MNRHARNIAYGALIAAMYVALTHLQNLLLPGSATWAIQFRASEALCVLACFTPSAIAGVSVGCFLFNLTYSAALPLDILVGTAATALACAGMYLLRRKPLAAMALPALTNSLLVGWELTFFIGGGFWLNTLYVAIGELVVLYTLGWLLHAAIRRNGLDKRLYNC